MNKIDFINLHQHSEFSLLDGLGKTQDIVKRAKELGQNSIAITDHGTCGGHFNFNKNAIKEGVKPILGCEMYVVQNRKRKGLTNEEKEKLSVGLSDKEAKKVFKEKEKEWKLRKKDHLVLIAQNREGLENLYKIVSDASITGFYYKPRTDYGYIAENKNGLIVMSACLAGCIPQAIMSGDIEYAEQLASRFKDVFGENYYFEIQPNSLDNQRLVNKELYKISKKYDIPLVATNDNHYILKDDKEVQDTLLLLRQKYTWDDVKKMKNSECMIGKEDSEKENILLFSTDGLYIKSSDEMFESYKENNHDLSDEVIKTAMENTAVIAEKCSTSLDFTKSCFPATRIPKEDESVVEKMLDEYEMEDSVENRKIAYLKVLINKGWKERIEPKVPEEKWDEYIERLKYEFEVITSKGYTEYFLVVSEFIIWAKEQGILVGPARGSAAGCLISYLLKIIDIDPIPFGLYFERFLNPERSKTPDIDTDFPDDKREIVRQHIIDMYGELSVAQVVAYSTFSINMCFRDVARVYNLPLYITNEIAKLIITQHEGYKDYATIEENLSTMENAGALQEYTKHAEYGELITKIFKIVGRIQHQVRHASVAAAASVITESEIYNYAPMRRTKDGIAIEWDGTMISKTGLLKMDLLGIRCLKIIQETLNLLKEAKKEIPDLYDLKLLEDKKTLELFKKGDTLASFQFDSKGIREVLKNMKPTSFGDITAAAALYRPGPLSSGTVKMFCDKKNDKYHETDDDRKNRKFTKLFDPYLENTYGCIVYQEQIIFIFHKVFGLNMGDADLLRRAIDEKNEEKIKGYIDKIVQNSENSQIKDPDTLKEALDYIQKISGYSFNLSHSLGYSYVAWWTMYLKAHFPLEFGLSTLNNRIEHKDFPKLIKEFKNRWANSDIKLCPADVNGSKSMFEYRAENNSVYTGLLMLKGLGLKITQKIVNGQPYKSIEDLLSRKGIFNKSSLNILIKVGAFDALQKEEFGYINRRELWHFVFAHNYKFDLSKCKTNIIEADFWQLPKLKKKLKYPELVEVVKAIGFEEYSNKEKMNLEKEYYGFYMFTHPLRDKKYKTVLKEYKNKYESSTTTIERAMSEKVRDGETIVLFGNIGRVWKHVAKTGTELYFMTLEGEDANAHCLIWDKEYEKYKARLKEGDKCIFACKKSIYKGKNISFVIEGRFNLHDSILGQRTLDNLYKNSVQK